RLHGTHPGDQVPGRRLVVVLVRGVGEVVEDVQGELVVLDRGRDDERLLEAPVGLEVRAALVEGDGQRQQVPGTDGRRDVVGQVRDTLHGVGQRARDVAHLAVEDGQ